MCAEVHGNRTHPGPGKRLPLLGHKGLKIPCVNGSPTQLIKRQVLCLKGEGGIRTHALGIRLEGETRTPTDIKWCV